MFDSEDEIYYTVILSSLFFVLLISIIIASVVQYRKSIRMRNEERVRFQEELLRTQLEIQEQTFKTISQEIHDNIGQMLTLAKLNLNTVDLQQAENATEKIGSAKDLVGKAIQDLRDLSKTLNTETIAAAGLLNAIESELHLLAKTGTVHTEFHVAGMQAKLDAQKELIIFRIVQEALHNVVKHARASRVAVSASFEQGFFKLLIADDGCGFDCGAGDATGSGLRNMQSRSLLIGADWKIGRGRENGTIVRLTLPITT